MFKWLYYYTFLLFPIVLQVFSSFLSYNFRSSTYKRSFVSACLTCVDIVEELKENKTMQKSHSGIFYWWCWCSLRLRYSNISWIWWYEYFIYKDMLPVYFFFYRQYWKLHFVDFKSSPIRKVSNPVELYDLKTINISCGSSKIVEIIIVVQFKKFVNDNGMYILPPIQSGFRNGFSCSTGLLHISDNVVQALDEGKYC